MTTGIKKKTCNDKRLMFLTESTCCPPTVVASGQEFYRRCTCYNCILLSKEHYLSSVETSAARKLCFHYRRERQNTEIKATTKELKVSH